MLKTKFNRKFKKIIGLSTLASVTCSSNLIQSIKKQDDVNLILSLTQEDREKLLELISKQKTADGQNDSKLQYPCSLVRQGDIIDNDDLDDVGEHCRGWIHVDMRFKDKATGKGFGFNLLKNKKDNKIYFIDDTSCSSFYTWYEKLKGTEKRGSHQ